MKENESRFVMWRGIPLTVPNILSMSRICLAPLMIIPALSDARLVFLVLFAICLVTDFLDGFLARLLKQMTLVGTRLDTLGDIAMYSSVTICGWFLWPAKLSAHSTLIICVIVVMILDGLFSLIKHRRLPSYHTWLTKTASAALGAFFFLMFAGFSDEPFRAALFLLIAASVEEIIITFILPEPASNIRSIHHAVKERQRLKAENEISSV